MRRFPLFTLVVVLVAMSCGGGESDAEVLSASTGASSTTAATAETAATTIPATTTTATTTTTAAAAATTTTTEPEDQTDPDALLEGVPEFEGGGAVSVEEIHEGGVHVWATSDLELAPGISRAVELSFAFMAAIETSGWTPLTPDPQCILPAGSAIDSSGVVVGDPFVCGLEAEHDDGRHLSISAGGEPMLDVDLCVWPSVPADNTCPSG